MFMKVAIFLCILLTFMLTGCAGTAQERRQMRNEGINLNNNFRKFCSPRAWKAYPTNIQSISVKKQRIKKVSTGSRCEPDITYKDQTICRNTYKNVRENYTVKEARDVNKRARFRLFRSCIKNKCTREIGPITQFDGDLYQLLRIKLHKCIGG